MGHDCRSMQDKTLFHLKKIVQDMGAGLEMVIQNQFGNAGSAIVQPSSGFKNLLLCRFAFHTEPNHGGYLEMNFDDSTGKNIKSFLLRYNEGGEIDKMMDWFKSTLVKANNEFVRTKK